MSTIISAVPAPLTTEAFLAAVDLAVNSARGTCGAVFDFDGTLWPGDAGSGFMRWTMGTGVLSEERSGWLRDRHLRYHRGEVDEITICGEMVQVYAGIPEAEIRAAAQAYFEQEVALHLFPVMVDLVQRLLHDEVELWAVSSTNDWLIEAGVRSLGIPPKRVLAACVHSQNGIVTDRLRDVPSDEGKAAALRRAGLDQPDLVFGNSIHDAAMLELARQPFAINPNPRLRQLAAERSWPVYYPVSETYRGEDAAAADAESV